MRRLHQIDRVKSGGWIEHGDGTRTHVGSPYGIHAGHAISSDGRAYRKDFFRGWRRDPLFDEPRQSTRASWISNGINNLANWKFVRNYYHQPYRAVFEPRGCGILGCMLHALWMGLCLFAFLVNWWHQSPASLVAVGITISALLAIRPLLRWARRTRSKKPPSVCESSAKTTHAPAIETAIEQKTQAERLRPRTAAQLDVYD